MTGGELAVVIEGRRGGLARRGENPDRARAHPGTERDLLVRGRARPRRRTGLVPERRGGRRPDAGEDAPRPRRSPGRRPHRLDHAGPPAQARHQPLRGPGLRSRRHVDRTSAVVKMDSLAPSRRGRARAPDAWLADRGRGRDSGRLPRRAPRPGESPGERLDGGGRGVLPAPQETGASLQRHATLAVDDDPWHGATPTPPSTEWRPSVGTCRLEV